MTEQKITKIMQHNVEDLIELFNGLFKSRYHTVLVRGENEPLYLPSTQDQPAQILFAHGFFSSALHEIAHWCLAGPQRRRQLDYGYWYVPGSERTETQQSQFLKMEVKPQALESLFADSCGFPFRISLDNLHLTEAETSVCLFDKQLRTQRHQFKSNGLPHRGHLFNEALQHFYQLKQLKTIDSSYPP